MQSKNYQQVSILLVEDDDVDAESIQRALKKLRIANPVYRAKDGLKAISMLQNDEVPYPRIILLDLNLPKKSGLEVLEFLRSDKTLRSSIVFVLTTSKSDEDICAAYQKNVAGYIIKDEMTESFEQVLDMLSTYWRLIEIPAAPKDQ
ncbi:response regulator [Pleionea mediterranea]|jgi:CheY-like chemotaxis protein|uniref:Response regulator receiver domain-containing protein n=1 Tax=Pleionea mediterranea TaxID=523701 RepID=A0A316G262_9GAMM|nr:response regulator [Pleionea mediterranea]PWK53890.1 response regulator receiver domain-containing protein [Pleionea mediterranea]